MIYLFNGLFIFKINKYVPLNNIIISLIPNRYMLVIINEININIIPNMNIIIAKFFIIVFIGCFI